MAAAISAVVSLAEPPRITVTLTGWSTSGDLSVWRVHPDGTRHLVRGNSGAGSSVAISGGVGAALDYEAPHAVAVSYEAMDGASMVSSASVSIADTDARISLPGLPPLSVAVELVSRVAPVLEQPGTVLQPVGRTTAVVFDDVRKAGSFAVTLRTRTHPDARELLAILTQEATSTVLLRMPGALWDWAYVRVGSVTPHPVTHFRPADMLGLDASDSGAWHDWDLPCTVVDSPAGVNYGDPSASWTALNAAGKTWDALKAAGTTWLDLFRGMW